MKTYIKAIAGFLPEQVLTNDELQLLYPDWSVAKAERKVGIKQRHVAGENETALDMAVKAAECLFNQNEIAPEDIDYILFCTQSPDYFLPTSACIIQSTLGIPRHAGAVDINQGCSGFIYGLSLAKGLVGMKIAKNVLLLTAETYTKYLHPADKGNRMIFGDGAAATLISTDGILEIGDFSLGTDGTGAENLIVRTGGARHRQPSDVVFYDDYGMPRSHNNLFMAGSKIFNFALDTLPGLAEELYAKNEVTESQIDWFVFHQANKFMIDMIINVMSLQEQKCFIDLANVGNTVSSTLPLALRSMLDQNLIRSEMKLLLAGFGVGHSWGGTVLRAVNMPNS